MNIAPKSFNYSSILNSNFPLLVLKKISTLILTKTIKDVFQILFLRKGKIHFYLKPDSRIVQNKSIVFIPEHTKIQATTSADTEIFHIIFKKAFLHQPADTVMDSIILNKFMSNFLRNTINVLLLQETAFFKISTLCSEVFIEQNSKRAGYKSIMSSRFTEIIITLFRIQNEYKQQKKTEPLKWGIDDVIHYIDINYTENFTLHDMAGRCGLNPSYFSRIFKNRTGISLFEYLNRIRIRKACMLLNRSDMTILNVAYTVGYNNISFFNRYFRKIMNMSPREYQKNIRP